MSQAISKIDRVAVAIGRGLVAGVAATAAPPPWRRGIEETAISALHHVVYAATGEAVYQALVASNRS
jgi:hypothetical protein